MVHNEYMVTAAHVVKPGNVIFNPNEINVVLASGLVVQPTAIWVHPLYGSGGYTEQDVAVLTFAPQTFAGRYKISIDPADHAVGTAIEIVGTGNKGTWSAYWSNWLEQDNTKGPVRFGTNVISIVSDGGTRPKASFSMDFDSPQPLIWNYNRFGDVYPATQSESGVWRRR